MPEEQNKYFYIKYVDRKNDVFFFKMDREISYDTINKRDDLENCLFFESVKHYHGKEFDNGLYDFVFCWKGHRPGPTEGPGRSPIEKGNLLESLPEMRKSR